jgi:hypothetical protein
MLFMCNNILKIHINWIIFFKPFYTQLYIIFLNLLFLIYKMNYNILETIVNSFLLTEELIIKP